MSSFCSETSDKTSKFLRVKFRVKDHGLLLVPSWHRVLNLLVLRCAVMRVAVFHLGDFSSAVVQTVEVVDAEKSRTDVARDHLSVPALPLLVVSLHCRSHCVDAWDLVVASISEIATTHSNWLHEGL